MDGAIQTTNRFNNGLKHKPWVLGLRIEEFSILLCTCNGNCNVHTFNKDYKERQQKLI